jgi:hypothetical protein
MPMPQRVASGVAQVRYLWLWRCMPSCHKKQEEEKKRKKEKEKTVSGPPESLKVSLHQVMLALTYREKNHKHFPDLGHDIRIAIPLTKLPDCQGLFSWSGAYLVWGQFRLLDLFMGCHSHLPRSRVGSHAKRIETQLVTQPSCAPVTIISSSFKEAARILQHIAKSNHSIRVV